MKRTQVSTNIGWLVILGGFLDIYQNVKITDFFTVFQGLTFGQVMGMVTPFITGLWAILHNEKARNE